MNHNAKTPRYLLMLWFIWATSVALGSKSLDLPSERILEDKIYLLSGEKYSKCSIGTFSYEDLFSFKLWIAQNVRVLEAICNKSERTPIVTSKWWITPLGSTSIFICKPPGTPQCIFSYGVQPRGPCPEALLELAYLTFTSNFVALGKSEGFFEPCSARFPENYIALEAKKLVYYPLPPYFLRRIESFFDRSRWENICRKFGPKDPSFRPPLFWTNENIPRQIYHADEFIEFNGLWFPTRIITEYYDTIISPSYLTNNVGITLLPEPIPTNIVGASREIYTIKTINLVVSYPNIIELPAYKLVTDYRAATPDKPGFSFDHLGSLVPGTPKWKEWLPGYERLYIQRLKIITGAANEEELIYKTKTWTAILGPAIVGLTIALFLGIKGIKYKTKMK